MLMLGIKARALRKYALLRIFLAADRRLLQSIKFLFYVSAHYKENYLKELKLYEDTKKTIGFLPIALNFY